MFTRPLQSVPRRPAKTGSKTSPELKRHVFSFDLKSCGRSVSLQLQSVRGTNRIVNTRMAQSARNERRVLITRQI